MSGKRRLLAIVVGIVVAGGVSFADWGAADAHPVHAAVYGTVHGGHVAVAPVRWGYGAGYRGYGYAPRYYSYYSPYAYAPAYASVYGYVPNVYSYAPTVYGYAPSVYSYAPSVYSYAPTYYYPPAVRIGVRPVYRGRYYW